MHSLRVTNNAHWGTLARHVTQEHRTPPSRKHAPRARNARDGQVMQHAAHSCAHLKENARIDSKFVAWLEDQRAWRPADDGEHHREKRTPEARATSGPNSPIGRAGGPSGGASTPRPVPSELGTCATDVPRTLAAATNLAEVLLERPQRGWPA